MPSDIGVWLLVNFCDELFISTKKGVHRKRGVIENEKNAKESEAGLRVRGTGL